MISSPVQHTRPRAAGTTTAGSRPRVCHVVLSLDCGGLERIVVDLVRDGRDLGMETSVLCLEKPGVMAREVERLGGAVVSLGKRPGLSPRLILRIREKLAGLRPDVVHTHQIGALLYAGPAARMARVPAVVHTEHGNHLAGAGGTARRARGRLLFGLAGRFASRIFCVSEEIAEALASVGGVPRERMAVVPNGIDTDKFATPRSRGWAREQLGIPGHARVIGTVGRLNEVKRQDLLIRAFGRVAARCPDSHLMIVGDGPLRGDLQILVDRLGLSGRVHFAGHQDHPERFLPTMDLFALTSRSEGMPLAVLEAWAAGLPVVASGVGRLPKVIDDGRTGLLFPSGDEVRLESCLIRLLEDSVLSATLGSAGRAEVNARYSLRQMTRTYASQYEELLAARPDHRGR
ncbi:MAG: glycosyltransferase [Isosphaeraceae bacterium]